MDPGTVKYVSTCTRDTITLGREIMSAGTTDPDETVTRAKQTHDGYLVGEVDRIDLSDLQLDDDDDWWVSYAPPLIGPHLGTLLTVFTFTSVPSFTARETNENTKNIMSVMNNSTFEIDSSREHVLFVEGI